MICPKCNGSGFLTADMETKDDIYNEFCRREEARHEVNKYLELENELDSQADEIRDLEDDLYNARSENGELKLQIAELQDKIDELEEELKKYEE